MEWEREFWHISFLTTVMSIDSKILNFARCPQESLLLSYFASCLYFVSDTFADQRSELFFASESDDLGLVVLAPMTPGRRTFVGVQLKRVGNKYPCEMGMITGSNVCCHYEDEMVKYLA